MIAFACIGCGDEDDRTCFSSDKSRHRDFCMRNEEMAASESEGPMTRKLYFLSLSAAISTLGCEEEKN